MQGVSIIFYCQSGYRSAQALEVAQEKYPELTFDTMEGGILAWSDAGLPTIVQKNIPIPMNRQVLLTVGILLLIFTNLGLAGNNNFFYPIGFIALGLINAGATGWCGMAKLLSLAPWNKRNTNPKET